MRKLKLELDTLEVETFDTRESGGAGAGTVGAHSYFSIPYVSACSEPASQYCMETDYHWDTCGNSCINDCRPTGNDPACYD